MQNKKSVLDNVKYILVAVILIFTIGVGVLVYLWNKEEAIPTTSILTEVAEDKDDQKEETVIAPEEKWKTYVSSELGFSIKYPQMVYRAYKCDSKKPFYVPLRVFEDKESGIIYITEEYYYKGKYDSELNKYTGPCEKIMNSLELLQKEKEEMQKGEFSLWWKPFLGWAISTGNIKNENELNKFIKDNYSSGCFAESRNSWQQQAGVYEIKLNGFKDAKGNNTDLGNAVCPVNYVYKILYISEKDKVMSVKLGQECNFRTNLTKNYKCYDDKMINSFKFE